MRLQRAPVGLLGALDLKVDGKNPPAFEDAIRGTLDVGPYYYAPLVTKSDSNSVAAPVDGTLLTLDVPLTENWLLYAFSGAIGLHATDVIVDPFSFHLGYRENANAAGLALQTSPALAAGTLTADLTLRAAIVFPDPFLAPGGSRLTMACNAATGLLSANAAFVISALVYRFNP